MAVKFHPKAKEEIDAYIHQMPDFSKAICTELRKIILNAVEGITEDWKWGPNYYYEGMVCGYAGFKQHVKLTFFNGNAMKDAKSLFNHCVDNEFSRSIKFTDIQQIDAKILAAYVKESAMINKAGYKREVKNKTLEIPDYFIAALKKDKTANKFFDELSYSCKKEYVEWISSAKKEETRNTRIEKALQMLSSGTKMNDKYKKQ